MSHNRGASKRTRARAVVCSVAFAIAIYAVAVGLTGYEKVAGEFARVSAFTWSAALALSLSSFILRFHRWHFLLRRAAGRHAPYTSGLAYYLAGFALTMTPAKVGEGLRLWYLRKNAGIAYSDSVPVFVLEQVLDVLAVAILSLLAVTLALPNIDKAVWISGVLLAVGLVPIVLGRADRLGSLMRAVFKRRWREKFDGIAAHGDAFGRSLRSVAPPHILGFSCAIGLVAWLAPGIGLYLILQDLQLSSPITPQMAVGLFSLSLLGGVVVVITGGIGTTEGALVLLLAVAGTDTPTAITAAIISRATTLWFSVGLGAFAALVLASVRSTREDVRA